VEKNRTLATPDGRAIRYRLLPAVEKSSRLVVLIHGMASNLTRWSEFVQDTSLKENWNLLRLDLRGHGESVSRGPIGMKIWCDDLVAILDTEGCEQAVMIGHSLGAQVAVQFADRYPARTRGLVLIDPVFHQALRGWMWWIHVLKPLIWLTIGGVKLLNAAGIRRRRIPNRDLHRLDERTRATILQSGNRQDIVSRYSSPWPDLKHFPTANYLHELIESVRPLPPIDHIKQPVLVLLSSGLTYTDLDITKTVIARFPNAQTKMIDAYHWPLTERPRQVRETIEQWCGRL
jgi:esterase